MNKLFLNQVFDEYQKIYNEAFKYIYPAKNSTGFAEVNLSVNFSKAYEKLSNQNDMHSITWFEFQFGEKNNLHYDAIIINHTQKEIFIIEAKRLNNPHKKLDEIGHDIKRIIDFRSDNALSERILGFTEYKIYGVILSDIWTETAIKKEIFKSFETKMFVDKYAKELDVTFKMGDVYYNLESFSINETLQKYKLVSMIWEI